MKSGLFLTYITFLIIINIVNCGIFKFLEPVNYISSSKWRLSRDRSMNLGWNSEDHNDTIHSITTSSSGQYIISCSNDKLAKFHRVLMYPNLYPDWTHIYYGELKLRGYGNDDIENLKCLQTLDGKQLLTLSVNKKENRVHLDTFTLIELDSIENRNPIINIKSTPPPQPNINQLSNITNFNIIFPLDDYNEVFVNSSSLKSNLLKSHISKSSLKQLESNNHFSPYTTTLINKLQKSPQVEGDQQQGEQQQQQQQQEQQQPIFDLSLNGKHLLLSFDNKIKIQKVHNQSNDNGNQKFKWEIITIEARYKIQDVVFLPDNNDNDNSILVLLLDLENDGGGGDDSAQNYNYHHHQLEKQAKLILYKNIDGKKWSPIELEISNLLLSTSLKIIRNKALPQNDCILNKQQQPIFVGFQDDRFTVHLGEIKNDKLILIKSLPLPFHQELPSDPNHRVSVDFSKDSKMFSIQYPNSNTIYIYTRDDFDNEDSNNNNKNNNNNDDNDDNDDDSYSFRLSSIIDDLPIRSHGSVLLFNFKYNYLVTNFDGHLSFFRDFETQVSQCDPASRTKSFYLPSPPLKSNITGSDRLELEQFGLLYLLKIGTNSSSTSSISQIQIKILMYTIFGYSLVILLQRLLIPLEVYYIGPFIDKLLKKISFTKINIKNIQNILFYSIALVILLLSFYEITFQAAYTNDWPAHIHHIDQFLNPPSKNISIFNSISDLNTNIAFGGSSTTSNDEQLNYNDNNNNNNEGSAESDLNKLFPSIQYRQQKDDIDNSGSSSSSSSEEFFNSLNIKASQGNSNFNSSNGGYQYFSKYLPSFLRDKFDFDYNNYMHYHGPNTYPAGFLYLYTLLYYISNHGQSLQIFQLIWAFLEFFNFILIKKICEKLSIPIILAVLPILSNRLHLYNVRVVINDFPSTFLIHICILLLISKRFKLFSTLFSIIVSLKLNTIFHSPAILFIFFNSLSIGQVILNLSIMAFIQLLVGLPFLMVNPIAYFTNAYDFSRTLLWEKTRNFKFIGRLIYDSTLFNILLLLLLIITILIFIYKYQLAVNEINRLLKVVKNNTGGTINNENNNNNNNNIGDEEIELKLKRIYILSFISVNFFAVVWARGLYTPFMCWYFYTLPIILYFAKFSYTFIVLFWLAHEILFRFFKDFYIEMLGTFIFLNINLLILIRLYNNFNFTTSTKSTIPRIKTKTQQKIKTQ
ncbi:hypothetical protein ACTFIW_006776 [Dictyostelium discoideum]